jgi:hypothetical protein
VKDNMHLQPLPILWFVGHQPNLTINENKHHPLNAHTRLPLVITPISPHNIQPHTNTTQNGAMQHNPLQGEGITTNY